MPTAVPDELNTKQGADCADHPCAKGEVAVQDDANNLGSPLGKTQPGRSTILSVTDRAEHMRKVRQREAELFSEAGLAALQERALSVIGPAMNTRSRLAKRALAAGSRRQAVIWLRHAADALSTTVASEVACRAGCSACCHQGVLVSESEAELIGKAVHRTPIKSPSSAIMVDMDLRQIPEEVDANRFDGIPCTFLMGNQCSIWSERPVMCRLQASFDRDALLCTIVPDEQIQVPYLDASPEKALYLAKVGVGMLLADIRDWFPPNH